ncbi:uncharacterized protein BDR25DRAFT_20293 [Lindgomyces ingoldianus]|uniref:Uncharacterized protein n=1 Tax=Lindgomyces ingoldianus TaxID=673940 RepID=A0ACB6Q7V9_9PLEO|nr:uncharacterized protein BDR25DRAFT_20293 [Lindgomyces ingoldianus]KAF2462492.1 hypothetical protein BDR25DRAFT_20293 [Lindgomyces ingoldianus]
MTPPQLMQEKALMRLARLTKCAMLFPTTYHTYAYYITESSLQGLYETFLSIIYVLLTAGVP